LNLGFRVPAPLRVEEEAPSPLERMRFLLLRPDSMGSPSRFFFFPGPLTPATLLV